MRYVVILQRRVRELYCQHDNCHKALAATSGYVACIHCRRCPCRMSFPGVLVCARSRNRSCYRALPLSIRHVPDSNSGRDTDNPEWGVLLLSSVTPGKCLESTSVLDGRGVGVRVSVGTRFVSSPRRPDRLWGPPNLLSNGYRGLFLRG
jgi:hypothetical protein